MVEGETRISRSRAPIEHIELLPASCEPLPRALEAIREADLITLGPGSLYTSVVPNLLVKGVPAAIERTPALKACFVNLMWQPGETTGLPPPTTSRPSNVTPPAGWFWITPCLTPRPFPSGVCGATHGRRPTRWRTTCRGYGLRWAFK